MGRVDVWDAAPAQTDEIFTCGFQTGVLERYIIYNDRSLGSGGFGSVSVCADRRTGKEYAW